jgi:hypothetical protein
MEYYAAARQQSMDTQFNRCKTGHGSIKMYSNITIEKGDMIAKLNFPKNVFVLMVVRIGCGEVLERISELEANRLSVNAISRFD